ncbi:MAG: hypothetical protein M3022_04980 [Actinomycetota bacterium]|nr:hypothetical protein [Actinomycetota bacterium]
MDGRGITIEVLFFDGCPSHEALLPRLRELMAEAGVDAPVQLTRVESATDANQERFLGSPTLRVNGGDVEPAANRRTDFGLKCRLYATADGLRGRIPDDLVRAALGAHPTGSV